MRRTSSTLRTGRPRETEAPRTRATTRPASHRRRRPTRPAPHTYSRPPNWPYNATAGPAAERAPCGRPSPRCASRIWCSNSSFTSCRCGEAAALNAPRSTSAARYGRDHVLSASRRRARSGTPSRRRAGAGSHPSSVRAACRSSWSRHESLHRLLWRPALRQSCIGARWRLL